eukprot:7026818-Prymnesium_polylepis.1
MLSLFETGLPVHVPDLQGLRAEEHTTWGGGQVWEQRCSISVGVCITCHEVENVVENSSSIL